MVLTCLYLFPNDQCVEHCLCAHQPSGITSLKSHMFKCFAYFLIGLGFLFVCLFFYTVNPLGTQLEIQAILKVWLKTNETHIPSTQTLLYLQPFTPSASISVICTWAGLTRLVCSLHSEKCRLNIAWLNISWFRKLNNQLSLVDYLLCAGTISGFSLCCL